MYICSNDTLARAPKEALERQKVHRSCSWLSLLKLLLAEASVFCVCRVESSPFKLFLHTGHVSCCKRKAGASGKCHSDGCFTRMVSSHQTRRAWLGDGASLGARRARVARGQRLLPALTTARCSCCGRSDCTVTAELAPLLCSPLCTQDTPNPYLEETHRARRVKQAALALREYELRSLQARVRSHTAYGGRQHSAARYQRNSLRSLHVTANEKKSK